MLRSVKFYKLFNCLRNTSIIPLNKINIVVNSKSFSTGKKNLSKDIPVVDEFYDEEVENEMEFLDLATAIEVGGVGIDKIAMQKASDSLTWDSIEKAVTDPIALKDVQIQDDDMDLDDIDYYDEEEEDLEDPEVEPPGTTVIKNALLSDTHLAEHLSNFQSGEFMPNDMLNYNLPFRMTDEFPDPSLQNFIPDTSEEKHAFDMQGLRACPGKLQRRGLKTALQCHQIDLETLHHLDVLTLRRFISEDSEILSKKRTGLCAKCQRKVAKTVKRARNLGILPHLGEYELKDARPLQRIRSGEDFHDPLEGFEHTLARSLK